jgi:branched-chain amino acid aminotransferase
MITDTFDIKITKNENSNLAKFDFDNIKFGREFGDHMFIVDYADGAWGDPRVVPYENIPMSPATSAIHYGQSIFEGMKAFKKGDDVYLFRPTDNAKRLNKSAERMCMPTLPEDLFMEGLRTLINVDRGWVPESDGASLYIRPFMFATDAFIGVKPSETYRFIIFTCPVGKYYTDDVKVKIETHYSRSMAGGTGFAKAAGNYAAALYPAKVAQEQGYHQLIWTDAVEHKYIEESGTMNIVFQIGDTLVTPPSSETILAGITKNSVLTLAKEWGVKVEERQVEVAELIQAAKEGTLKEAFGAGTAATIANISIIHFEGIDYNLPPVAERKFSAKVLKELESIKRGKIEDKYGWVLAV